MMKPVPLPEPHKQGEKEITEIQLRQPRAGELRGLETVSLLRMDYNSHRTLIPRLCPALTANDIDSMTPKNLLAVQTEVVGFFVD